jgi:methionyl-tRNA formyltransferase
MNVLYFTNQDIDDWDLIPNIIKKNGDTVLTHTEKFDLTFIVTNNIDFIVSDRSRYLISADIIKFLKKKIVNLHPSFLPWNKGYHPNYWSIKEKTPHGVTLHFIDENIDTGDIIAKTRLYYSDFDTLKSTYDRSRRAMVGLFEVFWDDIREGNITGVPQQKEKGSLHYKIDFKNEFEKLKDGWDTRVNIIS